MKLLVATLLGIHALAHLVGFVWPWWVSEPLPYSPAPPPPLIDDESMRALSVLWLATAAAFMTAALARLVSARSWRDIATAAAVASLVLSIACWPGSLLGIPINAAILGLLRTRRSDRLHANASRMTARYASGSVTRPVPAGKLGCGSRSKSRAPVPLCYHPARAASARAD